MFRVALISMFITSAALADTWTVDDDGKADFDNIQSAIEASSNGDVIEVYPGTYTKAGTATNVITYQNKNISIQSTGGSAVTIIDGENTKRPVQCFSSGQLIGFTLTNGYHSVRGGGLSIGGPNSPTIRDCVIRSNSSPDGGGLSIRAQSNPTFYNCIISDNNATDGGGVYVITPASAFFAFCAIQNNVAKQGSGGFHCEPNTNVALQGSTVCGNTSGNNNGQITGELDGSNSGGNSISELCNINVPGDYATIQEAIDAATDGDTILIAAGNYLESNILLTDKSITISGQTNNDGSPATTIDGDNDSIFLFYIPEPETELVVENLIITGADWRGIYAYSDGNQGGLIILNNCLFTENDSRALQIGDVNVIVSDCKFVDNGGGADGNGTGIWTSSTYSVDIVGCEFTGNSTTSGEGAGIYNGNTSGLLTVIATLFCDNTPDNISGSWIDGGSNCLAYSCDDPDGDGVPDKCDETGDGAYVVSQDSNSNFTTIQDAINSVPNGSEIVVEPGTYVGSGDSVINTLGKQLWIHSSGGHGNTIIDGEGVRRGVVCTNGETNQTVIEGFAIWNCAATDSQGGDAVYLDNSSPTIISCHISGATGIGLRAKYSDTLIESCEFMGCAGRAIMISSGNLVINDCLFSENIATDGSAIWAQNGELTISHSTFEYNDASDDGGALHLWATVTSLTSCDFDTNSAGDWGGAIYIQNEKILLDDCNFSNNAAPEGSGIFASKTDVIFVGESSASDDIKLYDHNNALVTLQFSPGTNCVVTGDVTCAILSSVVVDIDSLDPKIPQLDISGSLTMDGSLFVRNDSGSLFDARLEERVPLARAASVEGEFSSVVFPIMPPGRGLQLIEQTPRGDGETEIAVEVVAIDGADFSDTYVGDLDSPPVDMIFFNANNEGSDELAILYGGTPGGVTIYSVSSDGTPTPIEGFNAITGDDPVDIDAGDINGDGLDDLIVANSSNNSVTVLLTLEDANGGLSFDTFSLDVNDSFGQSHPQSCVSIINWDGDQYLDAVVGVDSSSTGYRVINDIGLGKPNDGPWFDSEEGSPTSVDGGDSLGSAWGFVAGTSDGKIQYASSGEGLLEVAQLGDAIISYSIIKIEASDMNDGTGDGLLDLMIASDDAETIFLMEGEMDEQGVVYGFGELIPIYVGEEMTDVEMLDADSDGDMDILLALPDSDTPLLLLRNDGTQGTSGIRTGGLEGRTWSKESENEYSPVTVMTGGSLSGKDDDKDLVIGGGESTGTFRGNTLGVIEQTNISFDSMCSEDLNGDGIVGVEDLLILIAQWGTCSECSADFDGDAIVGVEDLLILIAAWGSCK